LSREILSRKAGVGDAVGKERWSSGRSLEKSAHLLEKAGIWTLQVGIFPENVASLGMVKNTDLEKSEDVKR
jgi:hypothetical protein